MVCSLKKLQSVSFVTLSGEVLTDPWVSDVKIKITKNESAGEGLDSLMK